MANWCVNMVKFKTDKETLEQIKALFLSLAAKESLKQEGQLPDFIPSSFPYFFDIRWEDDDLYYHTKWSPNIDSLVEVSKHFKVDHIHFYCEPACLLYGEANYTNGQLKNTVLKTSDFKSYTYNKEEDTWSFEGQTYDDVYEVWEILLERRKQIEQ